MKKILLIFLGLLLIPMIVDAKELTIKNPMLVSNSSTASLINEPKIEDLNINLDYSLKNENDFIKYSFLVNNITDEDYKIAITGNTSSYVDYKINTDKISKNGDTLIELTTTYKNVDMLDESKKENNVINISLVPTLSNGPSNGKIIYGVMAIALIGFSIIILAFNKKLWFTIPLTGAILYFVVPTSLATPLITINNNVILEKNDICNSFSEDDWKQISRNIRTDNIACYNAGDEKEILLANGNKAKVVLLNVTNECENKESCGFIFGFKDAITIAPFNNEEPASSYKDSTIRYYLNDTVVSLLPEDLKVVLNFTKLTEIINEEEVTYSDNIYLLDTSHIIGENALEYFKASEDISSMYEENKISWWTRNVINDKANAILENGSVRAISQTESLGLNPVFRIK